MSELTLSLALSFSSITKVIPSPSSQGSFSESQPSVMITIKKKKKELCIKPSMNYSSGLGNQVARNIFNTSLVQVHFMVDNSK